jgi:formylglycine-generating enzyme required for sulfatase activity
MGFCRKLTERERAAGRLPEGYAYTLPTEAQWEYACRAGTTGDYAGNLASMGWYKQNRNSGNQTHAVGQKQANAWGLYDMHGNVWEWCADWYADKLPGGSVRDPTGAASGSLRVFRGGGWGDGASLCRSASRSWGSPGSSISGLGFRLALSSISSPPQVISQSQSTVQAPNKTLSYAQSNRPYENSLGMKFLPLPGTQVLCGIWETRVQDFEAFVNATRYDATGGMYSFDETGNWALRGATWKSPGFTQSGRQPVVGVSQEDARAFCAWLTKKEQAEGRLGAEQSYRLPTDAEWDAAVGSNKYPWGDQFPPPNGAGNYADATLKRLYPRWRMPVIEGYEDGYGATAPVGSFTANRLGIYDLGGNAWEWVEDRNRGARGASFYNDGSDRLASSYRSDNRDRGGSVGFRVVVGVRSAAR